MSTDFEIVIGLEVHCQLATNSKLFCGCPARLPEDQSVADLVPNQNTCAVCAGHPGTLPALNQRAVEYAIKAGLATQCTIRRDSLFARKNYFYPDLPKGYQISQYEKPLCENGFLEVEAQGAGPKVKKKIQIVRIHMEEDAGKNLHQSGYSLVNLNRAGVPLIEIVSAPDLRSAEEAGAYLRSLYSIVTYLEITDGNLEEGNFRCDVNVSVRPRGSQELGTRTEIKNLNSFRFVEKAITYEASRQIEVLQSGGEIHQETRSFDPQKGITRSMRSKEEAHDYRYFPEPDLLPIVFDEDWVEKLKKTLPELPHKKKERYAASYGLNQQDAERVTATKEMAELYEATVSQLENQSEAPKVIANFLSGEVTRLVNETKTPIEKGKLTSGHLTDLFDAVQSKEISSTGAKQVLGEIWETGRSVKQVVEEKGLKQVSDTGALEPIVDEILGKFPEQVEAFRGGKTKVMGFFIGQAMKATQGKANPGLIQELLKKKIQGTK